MFSGISVTTLSLIVLGLHTVVATYLLRSKAKDLTDWHIRIVWGALGQLIASGLAMACAFGTAALIAIEFGGNKTVFLFESLALFLGFWAIFQFAVIPLLARKVKRRFLFPWKQRRVGLATISSMLVVYAYVGIAGFAAWWYENWRAKAPEPAEIQQPATPAPPPTN